MRLYSAVVDPHGLFPIQAERLVWSLMEFAGIKPEQIVLHVVGGAAPTIEKSLGALGVELVPVTGFPGHPFCNKLQQLSSLMSRDWEDAVLLDCDVVVLEDLPRAEGVLMGKAVDFPNPPMVLLKRIFAKANLPLRQWASDIDGRPTAWANCNGGVYVVDRGLLPALAPAWLYWANWCMKNQELFEQFWNHVDQVSFAMAVASEELPFKPLHHRWNFPSHVSQTIERDCEPALIHYHRATNEAQCLLPMVGLPQVNDAITKINDAYMNRRRATFDNAAFWNARYSQHPELGSGIGSRGEILEHKRILLERVVGLLAPRTVADVGGGDGEAIANLPDEILVCGHDIAPAAEARYRNVRRNNIWRLLDICDSPLAGEPWDLVVCLDMLIHLADKDQYQRAIANLTGAQVPLLISGFEAAPVEYGPMTYFHEPLSRTLHRLGWIAVPIGAYRGLALFCALPPGYIEQAFGIPDDLVQSAIPFVDDPLLALSCISKSVERLGFFPNHLPRIIEYPWILGQINSARTCRIADAGAGVSVLPLMLADAGHSVVTIDSHTLVRSDKDRSQWNEWGFLDYSTIDPRITSEHTPYEESAADALDIVLSVSVIEHLTTAVRRAWLKRASDQLSPAGRLLLTVDTVPFTRELWNHSEGRLVEPPSVHGSVDDLLREIADAGFSIIHVDVSPYLPQSRVGMAKIVAQTKK